MIRSTWSMVVSLSLLSVAGTALAQGQPVPVAVDAPKVERAPVAEKSLARAPRTLDELVPLRVVKVRDGRVLAGQRLARPVLNAMQGLGFARVQSLAGVRSNTIHEDRLYRSYRIAEGSRLTAADFERLEGREVRARVIEVVPGRVYAISELVGR